MAFLGMMLDEIMLVNTPASFEPALDYVVTKMPRFPFDKFIDANQKLGTQMKAIPKPCDSLVGKTCFLCLIQGFPVLHI